MPPGLELNAEKSAPSAVNAPPMLIYLAVPPKVVLEYRRASTSFCDHSCDEYANAIARIKMIFFIILKISVI
jgi:hypothetical protein